MSFRWWCINHISVAQRRDFQKARLVDDCYGSWEVDMSGRRIRLVIVLAIRIVIAGIVLLFIRYYPSVAVRLNPQLTEEGQWSYFAHSGIVLPKTARILAFYDDGGGFVQGFFLWGKVAVQPEDLDSFLGSLPNAKSTSPGLGRTESVSDRLGIRNDMFSSAPRWWNPDSARTFRAVQIRPPDSQPNSLAVFVDMDNSDEYIVYILVAD